MYQYRAKVLKVTDGDTIEAVVDLGFKITIREKFRLYGVNTPESRTRDKEEKKKGLAAKEFVKKRIMDREVTIETTKKGKFGRYLAKVYYSNAMRENICLNDQLILEGHAKEYFGGKRT